MRRISDYQKQVCLHALASHTWSGVAAGAKHKNSIKGMFDALFGRRYQCSICFPTLLQRQKAKNSMISFTRVLVSDLFASFTKKVDHEDAYRV